jgi:hypothetical protein
MPSRDFRAVFLPYCLKKQSDGSYVVLNRDYKPIGLKTMDHINYEKYRVKIPGLKARLAAVLSISKSVDVENIYLYDDKTSPTQGKKNMTAYLDKLEILSKLKLR